MTLYSRRQLALLIAFVALGGVGLAVGEWRRANPTLTAAIESFDRKIGDDRPGPVSPTPAPPQPHPNAALSSRSTGHTPRPHTAVPERPPKRAEPAAPLDLNRATAAELTRLPGIGPVLAARIVAQRAADGPFRSIDDLRRVSGVGSAKLSAFREHLTVAP